MTNVEGQLWWRPKGADHFSHVHLGGILPTFDTVRGVLPYELRVKLHHASGVVNKFEGLGLNYNPGFRGAGEHLLDDFYVRGTFDSTRRGEDGPFMYQMEASFRDDDPASVPAGTQTRKVRIRSAMILNNGGRPVSSQSPNVLTVHGWFAPSDNEGRGYTNVEMQRGSLLDGPISTPWTPKFTFRSSKGDSRHAFVSLDPDIHNGNVGRVLVEQRNVADWLPVTVDPSELTEGPHKLFVKASDEGMFPSGDLETVLVYNFTVVR